MTSVYVKYRALKREYERRGKEATEQQFSASDPDDKLMYAERARFYFEIASSLSDMDERRVDQMRGRNVGMKPETKARLEFLRSVAQEIGARDPDTVATSAIEYYSSVVRRLWKTPADSAHRKVMNFIKNNPL